MLARRSATWTRAIANLDSPLGDVLIGPPFLATPGVRFDVTWIVGAYRVTGYASLSARLDFISVDGSSPLIVSCRGRTAQVTVSRSATWSGIKALTE
jgi:hypothetical protein